MTAARELFRHFQARAWSDARALLCDDFVADWPQTRELIEGADAYIGLNSQYPEGWSLSLLDEIEEAERVVTRLRIIHPPHAFTAISFFTVRGDRLATAIEYFPEDMEPPYDRSAWARRY